jgi:hypothetical protein
LPGFIKPQLATLKSKALKGGQWLHEIKFDGYPRGRATRRPRGGHRGSFTAGRYRHRSLLYSGRGGFLRGIPKPVIITGIRLLPIKMPFSFIATSI